MNKEKFYEIIKDINSNNFCFESKPLYEFLYFIKNIFKKHKELSLSNIIKVNNRESNIQLKFENDTITYNCMKSGYQYLIESLGAINSKYKNVNYLDIRLTQDEKFSLIDYLNERNDIAFAWGTDCGHVFIPHYINESKLIEYNVSDCVFTIDFKEEDEFI